METYEQKVERVAIAIWLGLASSRSPEHWPDEAVWNRQRYLNAARAALEEEARDIVDVSDEIPESKLTMPLRDGQKIELGDGRIGLIAEANCDNICKVLGQDGQYITNLFRDTGLCRNGTRECGPPPRHDEAVADAPKEEA